MMSAPGRGGNAAAAALRRRPNVCASCRTTPFRRPYSEAAAAATMAEAHHLKPTEPHHSESPITSSRRQEYRLKSGIILTRAPLLTRTLTPFENAFFYYQKRLNERLALPFIHSLFFKKDTAPELDWKIKFAERGRIAGKEIGRYWSKSKRQWNDELLVGSTLSDPGRLRDILIKDAEVRVTEDGEKVKPEEIVPIEKPMDRITEADRTNDVRRLDRKLEQTLHLVVKNSNGAWQFPCDDLASDETLHVAAERVLAQAAGVNMNTWIVGRVPVAHYVRRPSFKENGELEQRGEKVFFIKGKIMAGQADLTNNAFGYKDFMWLTRDELKEKQLFEYEYFQAVRNMMAIR